MRDDGFVRRVAEEGDRGQKRRLEPAPVLVVPFEVHVRGALSVRAEELRPLARAQHRHVRHAGVEPDVHDVALLLEELVTAPVRVRRKEVLRGARVPRVAALGPEDLDDAREELLLLRRVVLPRVDFAPLAVAYGVEQGDRRAPAALAGDHPLAAVLDHPRDALLAPGGDPLDGRDRVERALANVRSRGVEPHEPLDGRAEDDGLLAAPAVRVLVRVLVVHADEGARRAEVLDDLRVRVEDLLAPVLLDGRVPARLVDRREDRQALALARREVVLAVPRRGVDEARARVHGDVVAGDDPERTGLLLGCELPAHLRPKWVAVTENVRRELATRRPHDNLEGPFQPTSLATRSTRRSATRKYFSPTCTQAYSSSGWTAIATFDGIVQGVVVQMR